MQLYDRVLAVLGRPSSGSPAILEAQMRAVNAYEAEIKALSDDALRARWSECQAIASAGTTALESARLTEAFAILREVSTRTMGLRPYDVQIQGALGMSERAAAEMATGEGKTLVAGISAAYFALYGQGVHVATVNRYLATRDAEWMQPVFDFLGLSLGILREKDTPDQKRTAYACDITYGTGYEFGFDYLRDQLALRALPHLSLGEGLSRALLGQGDRAAAGVQRFARYAIVDEIDSVLIDEALTPLIISPPAPPENPQEPNYIRAHETAGRLLPEDYHVDELRRNVTLTPAGVKKVYEPEYHPAHSNLSRAWHFYLEQALRAIHCFQVNIHYLVRDGKVEIIDEYTGRSFPDRKWRDGLHQAVEAKEKVTVSPEPVSEVSISRQSFFQLYDHLCGMTGTARESALELQDVYRLAVTPIPRHRPSRLEILPDRVFRSWEEKNVALIAELERRHATGQPVLVGTRTVRHSETLADRLTARGLDLCVLNARQDAQEAELIGRAGEPGRITIATNMVGRGADIRLQPGAEELGGLFVLGQERHESPRLDRQLAGRAGRQGSPGSVQFFLSADDFLPATYGEKEGKEMRKASANAQGEISPRLARLILRIQDRVVEAQRKQRRALMRQDETAGKTKKHLAGSE